MSSFLNRMLVAGGLLALSASATFAADLRRDEPSQRYGSAYDDPRYADLYGDEPHPPRHRHDRYEPKYEPRYEPRYAPGVPIPRERVYRDERAPYERRQARNCPSKEEISRMLEGDGWSGFTNPQLINQERATIDARRPSGRPYRLEVDRCSGEILALRPIEGPRYGYAEPGYPPFGGEPRRFGPRSY